jgi:hypothetical protein
MEYFSDFWGLFLGLGIGALIFTLAIWVFSIICMWRVFEKAGKPGWAAIIPIYNLIVIIEIAGKPIWWIILFLIPIVNIVIAIMVLHGVSTSFGQGAGFTLGLIFLGIIFWAILAFGNYTHEGGGSGGSGALDAG